MSIIFKILFGIIENKSIIPNLFFICEKFIKTFNSFKMHANNTANVFHNIIDKCYEDKNYKKTFLADPISKVSELIDPKTILAPDVTLVAMDQSNPKVLYINIPPKDWYNHLPDTMELTDEQLEDISGGEMFALGLLLGILGSAAAYGIGYAIGM